MLVNSNVTVWSRQDICKIYFYERSSGLMKN
jgi:hypothetical protein